MTIEKLNEETTELGERAYDAGRLAARHYVDRGLESPKLIGAPVSLTQMLKLDKSVSEQEVAEVTKEWERGVSEEWDAQIQARLTQWSE